MFDLKKFLRIEISGYVCLLYTALFTTCFFILLKPEFAHDHFNSGFWYKGPIAAIPVALALGFIIHQVSITLLNPFCEYRTCFGKRTALISMQKRLAESVGLDTGDFREAYKRVKDSVDKNGLFDTLAGLPSKKNPSYPNYLRGEISRRYSYYYARIDASVFAPVFGLILSLFIWGAFIVYKDPHFTISFNQDLLFRSIPLVISVVFALIIFLGIFRYCYKLVSEINVLECALLVENYDYWFVKDILKEYEAGIRKTVNPTK